PAGVTGVDASRTWSQDASASRTALTATVMVACAVRVDVRGKAVRVLTKAGGRGHCADAGSASPWIHWRTARAAQNELSAVTTLCPMPGTTIRWLCGN